MSHVASLIVLTAKNFFRVSYRTGGQLQSHCFQASDTFNKQQWINCIRQAKEAAALTGGRPPETGSGGQIGPVLTSCSYLRQESDRGWGVADSGRCLEVEAGLSRERDVGLGGESLGDGGTSLETDTEARMGEDTTPGTSSETGEGATDATVGVRETDRGVRDSEDISASSCREDEGREEMEQSGSGQEEEASMDTSEVTSPQCEEPTHGC